MQIVFIMLLWPKGPESKNNTDQVLNIIIGKHRKSLQLKYFSKSMYQYETPKRAPAYTNTQGKQCGRNMKNTKELLLLNQYESIGLTGVLHDGHT